MNDEIDPREWQAQERGKSLAESASTAEDARDAVYLQIACALRQPKNPVLPADFAWRTAARARSAEFTRLEAVLMAALFAILGMVALALVLRFGGRWLLELSKNAWPLALTACAAASWAMGKVRQRAS